MPDQLTTSTPATLPPDDFVGEVRSALIHLYDNAYLQNHPLAQRFAQNGVGDTVTRAQRMRRLLLDSIGKLRSEDAPAVNKTSWRVPTWCSPIAASTA